MPGNIRLIGELYKKKMLTERIMHEYIKSLLGEYQNFDEEDVEALCKLMSTIGEMIDHPNAKVHINAYFDTMAKLSDNMKLSSRVRFMLKDTIDLRRNRWQQRRKVEGPKKIEEVHRDAAQERQQQSSRLTPNPGINISASRTPMDFGPRGSSMLSPPNARMSSSRWLSLHGQGGFGGTQDVRFEERQAYDARLSVPLPQRPLADITLGSQDGLARGMFIRGPPSIANSPAADPSQGDPRRMAPSLNGFGSMPQGGVQRNSPDIERWDHAINFQQKGLVPSPQTPLQVMHKAERKYEVGKVADDAAIREQAEENPEEDTSLLEPGVDSANVSTLADFFEAYGETPEALIKRLLSVDTDLLAFSHVLFASQMTAPLQFLTKLNTNDDVSQELAIRAVENARRTGYNAINDSFKLALPRFSFSEEKKLQQGIRDQEQKLADIHQSLIAAEQKLEEAKNRVAVLQVKLAEAEAEVARCQEGVTALTGEKAAISGSAVANRLSVRATNVHLC